MTKSVADINAIRIYLFEVTSKKSRTECVLNNLHHRLLCHNVRKSLQILQHSNLKPLAVPEKRNAFPNRVT